MKLSHLRVSAQHEQIHEFEKNILETNTAVQCFHNLASYHRLFFLSFIYLRSNL